MESSASKPDRALIVVLAVTALLVVVALIVVFVRSAPAQLDPDSAEGVVQRYATAVLSGDEDAAADLLSSAAKEDCGEIVEPWTDGMRVTLVSSTERATSAEVRVDIITYYDGGLFGGSEYTEPGTFELVQSGGDWRIDTVPWQLSVCTTWIAE